MKYVKANILVCHTTLAFIECCLINIRPIAIFFFSKKLKIIGQRKKS